MPHTSPVASRFRWRGAAAVASVGLVLVTGASVNASAAGIDSPASVSSATRKSAPLTTATSAVGRILVDGKGRTVYRFAADSQGRSACNASCLVFWPAVTAPATLPASVPGVTGKLGVLRRAGGVRQLTINGWPLYTYAGDTKKGMIAGQGVDALGAKWWVVAPSGARITKLPSSTSPQPTPPSASPSYPGGDY